MLFVSRSKRQYHVPLDDATLAKLAKKNFSDETIKKVAWVHHMYQEWRIYRHCTPGLKDIECDLDEIDTINVESLKFALCKFLTEVKKIDKSDFPAKTLYDILICIQFYMETMGFSWRLLNDDRFKEVRFTLDNTMKRRTADGIGISVRRAQVFNLTDKDILWKWPSRRSKP